MKITELPLLDEWYRIPGNDGSVGSKFSGPSGDQYYWVYVKNGRPIAVCYVESADALPNDEPNESMIICAQIWTRETGQSLFKILRSQFSKPECKHNLTWTNVSVPCPGMGQTVSLDGATIIYEDRLLRQAIDNLTPILKRTLRTWPSCACGGNIQVIGLFDRPRAQVVAGFACDCGY